MQSMEDYENRADLLIRRIVHDVAPQLGSLPSFMAKLGVSVSIALQHAMSMVATLGEPLFLEQNFWTNHPLAPVVFATPQDGLETIRRASALRRLFADPMVETCYFLMTMRRHEYDILGSEMDGEIVRREVRQTVIDFNDHRIPIVATSTHDMGHTLVDNIVMYLAGLAPERQRRAQAARKEILQNEELLKAQLQTLEQARREYRPFAVPSLLKAKLELGRSELGFMDEKLHALPSEFDADDCLSEVRQVLSNPDQYIRLRQVTENVLDFGIKSRRGRPIHFFECVYGGEKAVVVLLLGMNRATARHVWPDLEELPGQS